MGFSRNEPWLYLSGDNPELLDVYPELGYLRDIVYLLKAFMAPTSDALPEVCTVCMFCRAPPLDYPSPPPRRFFCTYGLMLVLLSYTPLVVNVVVDVVLVAVLLRDCCAVVAFWCFMELNNFTWKRRGYFPFVLVVGSAGMSSKIKDVGCAAGRVNRLLEY